MINFSKNSTNLMISGKTFYAKEFIKALGGTWDPSTSSWLLPVHIDSEKLRKDVQDKAFTCEKIEKDKLKAERAYAMSPEGIAETKEQEKANFLWALEEKKKNGSFHWICCEKCVVINWQKQHTTCTACAQDCGLYKNSFRVRGMVYTGD